MKQPSKSNFKRRLKTMLRRVEKAQQAAYQNEVDTIGRTCAIWEGVEGQLNDVNEALCEAIRLLEIPIKRVR